jgi:hypothetical protein
MQEVEDIPSCSVRMAYAHHCAAWTLPVRTDVSEGCGAVEVFRVSGSTKGLEASGMNMSRYLSREVESKESRGKRRERQAWLSFVGKPRNNYQSPADLLAPPARSLQDSWSMHASLRRHAPTVVHAALHLLCCFLLLVSNTSYLLCVLTS